MARQFNAQVRKEVKQADFDRAGGNYKEDDVEDPDDDFDNLSDDDQFIDGLEKRQKREEPVNLDRLTMRQRKAYMQKSMQGRGQFEMEDDTEQKNFDDGLTFKSKIRAPKT